MGNLATQASVSQGYGGGIQLIYDASQLINNTVVNNRSGLGALYSQGDGIDIQNSSLTTLLHNTIYDNKSGDFTGVYVDRFSTVCWSPPSLSAKRVCMPTRTCTIRLM
jgi:hypothetical protein